MSAAWETLHFFWCLWVNEAAGDCWNTVFSRALVLQGHEQALAWRLYGFSGERRLDVHSLIWNLDSVLINDLSYAVILMLIYQNSSFGFVGWALNQLDTCLAIGVIVIPSPHVKRRAVHIGYMNFVSGLIDFKVWAGALAIIVACVVCHYARIVCGSIVILCWQLFPITYHILYGFGQDSVWLFFVVAEHLSHELFSEKFEFFLLRHAMRHQHC